MLAVYLGVQIATKTAGVFAEKALSMVHVQIVGNASKALLPSLNGKLAPLRFVFQFFQVFSLDVDAAVVRAGSMHCVHLPLQICTPAPLFSPTETRLLYGTHVVWVHLDQGVWVNRSYVHMVHHLLMVPRQVARPVRAAAIAKILFCPASPDELACPPFLYSRANRVGPASRNGKSPPSPEASLGVEPRAAGSRPSNFASPFNAASPKAGVANDAEEDFFIPQNIEEEQVANSPKSVASKNESVSTQPAASTVQPPRPDTFRNRRRLAMMFLCIVACNRVVDLSWRGLLCTTAVLPPAVPGGASESRLILLEDGMTT